MVIIYTRYYKQKLFLSSGLRKYACHNADNNKDNNQFDMLLQKTVFLKNCRKFKLANVRMWSSYHVGTGLGGV